MVRSSSAYLHTQDNWQLFAIRLARLATLTALGLRDERYYGQLFARQIDWLTCLINARDERLNYDLRVISTPDPELYARGRIEIALLCRMDGASADEAANYARELLRLGEAFFDDEYEFGLVESAEELETLRKPFSIGAMVEVARRTELAALDTLRGGVRRPMMGFAPSQVTLTPAAANQVYHVYPYLPSSVSAARLFKLLLVQDAPLAVSFRLKPTALSLEEAEFLDAQIARCERYAQFSLGGAADDPEQMHPTLQEQARAFQRRLMRALYALKDNAALLRVEIVAPARVPQTVVDVLGAQLTLPAGGRGAEDKLDDYLSGGYEFASSRDEALARLAGGFAEVEWVMEPDALAPAGAGRLRYLFDAMEAAAAFRFPAPALEELPGVPLKTSRTQLAPATLPVAGQLIGHSQHNGRVQPVQLAPDDRRRHLYAVGQTGTGKTTMFEAMILADIRAGAGVCVLDPHGDLVDKLLTKIPKERAEDVVLLDPSDAERPVGLNVLEYETEAQKYFLVQELLAIIERLLEQMDPAMGGPMFYQHARMGLLLVMSNPDEMGTLVQFHQVFNAAGFYKRFLPLRSTDPVLEKFVEGTLARTDYVRQSGDGGSMGSYISSKFDGFVSDPMLRNIFGQRRSGVSLRAAMDEGRILLVNLSKGRLGELNSRFLGMVLIAKLQAAAMARAAQPVVQRRDFYLYVDEFQNLATLNFGTLLSEARKFRLNLILTNQYVAQVDPRISSAIAGNVGTLISFRVGALDAEYLEREFLPVFNRYDLTNLPNFNTYVTTLVHGQVSKPFSMQTPFDQSPENAELGGAVRELARLKYGRPRAEVEAEIAESLQPLNDWV